MKHIVFLVGSYYPNYSAVGKCIANIADCFSSQTDQYRVTVVAWNTEYGEDSQCELHNQHIKRISTTLYKNRLYFQNQFNKTTGIKKKLCHVGLLVCRACNAAKMFLNKTSIDQAWVRAYRAALDQIQEPIDAIIPTCSPFEAIVAAINYCDKKSIDMFPVLFDQFAANATLHRNRLNRHIKMKANCHLESIAFSRATHIFCMPPFYRYLMTHYSNIADKATMIEHPQIIQKTIPEKFIRTDDVIKMVYSGSLIKKYIEPTPILDFASHVQQSNYRFNFYVKGSAVSDIASRKLDNVDVNGWVDKKTLDMVIANADICLNIAETSGIQISSKIFDYISLGKPILHFYYAENDVNLSYLHKYPLALCIHIDNGLRADQAKKIKEWCETMRGCTMDFNNVKQIFGNFTPEYVSQLISKRIMESSHA